MSFVSEASIPEVSWSFTEDAHRSIGNRIVDGEPQIGSWKQGRIKGKLCRNPHFVLLCPESF